MATNVADCGTAWPEYWPGPKSPGEGRAMADKLQKLFEYRTLVETPGAASADAPRLERLRGQLAAGIPALDPRDLYSSLGEPVRVEIASGGRFRAGLIHNVGADGIAISTDDPPPLDQRVHIHVYDREGGHAYTAFGRVVARVVRGTPGISLAIEGRPTQTRLLSRTSGVFRTPGTPGTPSASQGKQGARR